MFFGIDIIIFLLGLGVGSFLNSLIYRLHSGLSLFKANGFWARSFCPKCQHQLSWLDLIPVLSFVLLKGKCRYCSQSISIQYPLIELATAFLFLAILHFQIPVFDLSAINLTGFVLWIFYIFYLLLITSALIVIFVFDLKYYLIPDEVIYISTFFIFLNRLLQTFSLEYKTKFWANFEFKILDSGWQSSLVDPLIVAFLSSLFFFLIFVISQGRWMGFGDVKLAFLMGFFLGFPKIIVALFFAFWFGAGIGLIFVLLKKKTMKSEIPFGPFLVLGTILALFWSQPIVNWYLNLVMFTV